MLGLSTQPIPRSPKWTQFIARANIACQRMLLGTREIFTRMRTRDPISLHRPSPLGFPPHILLGNMKEERHETSLSNPRKQQRHVIQRYQGRLGDPQAHVSAVKRRNHRTHVRFAAENMHKSRAPCDITELYTIPVHVRFAISNGVAPNIIGIISRNGINWKFPS